MADNNPLISLACSQLFILSMLNKEFGSISKKESSGNEYGP